MSQGANDFLQPCTPTITGATNVGTGRGFNDGAVDISFSASCPYPATSYTVLSSGGQTATGATSPIRVTGLAGGTAYTFQVKGVNAAGESSYSAASSAITATTLPATMAVPGVTTVAIGGASPQGSANTANDTVSWTPPANGGSPIDLYYWTSSDGKSGSTASTSVVVGQESNTAQTYTVYAHNGNGNGGSATSASITSAFSFTPFSVFSFSPFGVFSFSPFGVFSFSPFGVFSFSPFGVFSFSPFGVFGFSPFGFSPFGFSPFGVFSFSPFAFSPAGRVRLYSLGPLTKVKTTDGYKDAQDIEVGDELVSVVMPGLPDSYTPQELAAWSSPANINTSELTTTKVTEVGVHIADVLVKINDDTFSQNHIVFVNKNGEGKMSRARDVQETDLIWNQELQDWAPIEEFQIVDLPGAVLKITCEPNHIFFTESALVHDGSTQFLYMMEQDPQ